MKPVYQSINELFPPSHSFGFHTADTLQNLDKEEINKKREKLERLAYHSNKRKLLGYIPIYGSVVGVKRCINASYNKDIGKGVKRALITRGILETIPFAGPCILCGVDAGVTAARFIHLKLHQRS